MDRQPPSSCWQCFLGGSPGCHYFSLSKGHEQKSHTRIIPETFQAFTFPLQRPYMAPENLADFVQEEAVAFLWGWSWAVCEAALLGLRLGTSKTAGNNFLMLRQHSGNGQTSKAAFLLACTDGVKKAKASLVSLVKGNEKGTLKHFCSKRKEKCGPFAGWGRRLCDKGHRKHKCIQCLLHLFCDW